MWRTAPTLTGPCPRAQRGLASSVSAPPAPTRNVRRAILEFIRGVLLTFAPLLLLWTVETHLHLPASQRRCRGRRLGRCQAAVPIIEPAFLNPSGRLTRAPDASQAGKVMRPPCDGRRRRV